MHYLFESSDTLDIPIECFYYDDNDHTFPVKPHWHYFMEMIYIICGSAEMRTEDAVYRLSEGDMIIFHPKSVHAVYAEEGSPLRYAVMKFDINRLTLTSSYAPKLRSIFRSAEKRGMDIMLPRSFTESAEVGRIFTDCITEMHSGAYGADIIVRTRIYELLIKILRRWQEQGFSVDGEVFAEDSHYDIYNITEYIDANLSTVRVNDIARRCGMSYSYFAKKFLSVYGRSCKAYIESMRLFRVEELLLFTDFDLNYIAQETGFSDCSHMIKSFRRSRGLTPKQFRLRKGEKSPS